jgi:hypothetical protein
MGNPLRFFGAGTPIDLPEGGTIPGRCAVEVTIRAHQQQLLMRPSKEVNEIVLGCLGRVMDRYPELDMYVFSFESNHASFVCMPPSAWMLWNFMRDLLSALATRLNAEHDREGTLWERRYRAIPITDDAKLQERFAYCLLQGTKENLVASAREWPGVSAVTQLMGGPQLVGRWRDGTASYALRRQRERKLERAAKRGHALELPEAPEVWIEYPIRLAPLPPWADLRPGQRRARVTAIVNDDDEATRKRHRRDGTRPLGVAAIRATDPFARPARSKKSPAPLCHASTPALRDGFRAALGDYVRSVRGVAERVEASLPAAGLFEGATLAPLARKPPPSPSRLSRQVDRGAARAAPT